MALRKRLKKVLLGFFIAFFTLILLIIFGSSFFADRIGNAVIGELNENLKHEIKVEDYELTFLKHFPKAAVTLNKVNIPDAFNEYTLLEAEELSFRFGFFSLFGSKIKISSIVIDNGALLVTTKKNGKSNYNIFKETENNSSNSSSGDLAIKLEEAQLNEVELIYMDEKEKQDIKININELNMSGEFSGNRIAVKSDGDFFSYFVENTDGRFFENKNINYTTDIDVDLKNEKYIFNNFLLDIEGNKFSVEGDVIKEENEEEYLYNVNFDGKDCSLQSLIALLPDGYVENLIGLQSRGDFKFDGSIKGKSGENKQPKILVNLGLEDGKISGPQLNAPFKDLTFSAQFTNGEDRNNRSSIIEIKDFKGYLQRELIELKLKVKDLDNPKVELFFNGAIPLNAIYTAAQSDIISNGGGDLEFVNVQLNGYYKDMIDPNFIHRVSSKGTLEFDDAMLKINGEKITIDKGNVQLNDNILNIEDFTLQGLGSEIQINGTFQNLIPVLFSDSINSQEAQLTFNAQLDADELNIERWIKLSNLPNENSVDEEVYDSLKTKQLETREQISNFLNGQFSCNIKQFEYGKIKGENFIGKLSIKNNQLIVNGDLEAMDGTFDLDGIIYLKKEPELKAKLVCNKIDAYEFFYQTNDFGQDYLTHKNIKGDLSANILINTFWNKEGDLIMDKLRVLTGLQIEEGELNNFEMLESFSKFVKLDNLKNVRFTKTENWLEIKKETLYIPVMLIQNNAVNLLMSGKHTFEQDIDYNIKVNAGQVLANKMFKKAGSKPIKAKNGWFNLFYNISGNIEDYEMESDKRGVKDDFKRSEQHKARIKRDLEKEFGQIDELTNINELDEE